MTDKPDNYLEDPPEDLDYSKQEWLDLSYDMQYYYANESRRENIKNRNKSYKQKIKALKEEECCRVCGEDETCVLDWHHVDEGSKVDNIADMHRKAWSIETVREEINKCVLLCANCHRKLHNNVLGVDLSEKPRGTLQ